jgi:hypothetical protein
MIRTTGDRRFMLERHRLWVTTGNRDELHRRLLHSFRDEFRVAGVGLLSLRGRPHIFGRHQARVVAKRGEFTT